MLEVHKRDRLSPGFALAMVVLLLAVHAPSHALDAVYAADLMWQAKQRGDYLPDIYRLHPSLSETELYAIQRHYVGRHLAEPGAGIAGFKGGFIPAAPVGGVLYSQGLLRDPATVALADFTLLIVEAEIGFKFCSDVAEPLADVEALKRNVCGLLPVIEIADGAIADFAAVKRDFKHLRATLISMNVASSHILIGEQRSTDIDIDTLAVTMTSDGVPIGQRDPTRPSNLWRNTLWVVNDYVLRQGYRIAAQHIVIPGNLTGIHAAKAGEYAADFGELGKVTLHVE